VEARAVARLGHTLSQSAALAESRKLTGHTSENQVLANQFARRHNFGYPLSTLLPTLFSGRIMAVQIALIVGFVFGGLEADKFGSSTRTLTGLQSTCG